jgi:hypothetical protein
MKQLEQSVSLAGQDCRERMQGDTTEGIPGSHHVSVSRKNLYQLRGRIYAQNRFSTNLR